LKGTVKRALLEKDDKGMCLLIGKDKYTLDELQIADHLVLTADNLNKINKG
jgi:hypothetical protein